MEIFVYNENCILRGQQVRQRDLDRYDDPREGGDWHIEEVTEENAAAHERRGANDYYRTIAREIRSCL